jgi:bifunctional ADP-heptose synthase (sugar kinase/adenylyltransferase)
VDTRTKILTPAALAALDAPQPLVAVTGRFDILRTGLARELAAARERTGAKSLLAVVRPFEGELAPIEARAELAAALRLVDYVFIAENEDLASLADAVHAMETIDLEPGDAERTRKLIEHVHSRQSA